jgi:hypothetical protein
MAADEKAGQKLPTSNIGDVIKLIHRQMPNDMIRQAVPLPFLDWL